ncbi:hypothetical protein [Streptomyces mirabilis]|uniref:Uncharacterized protein n=1 Tax=Streptomyces mirabilis TaxID=68239 RepID=A0ABU3V5G6_9ACTN|nr:hypothetical protein [Streptomyces mirabilis]MCX5355609.1 hypothetical protein [Streptomyces mirabilis]MDU9001255.1 hypothetical protein [Streptomyces mirabilis]
MRGLAGRAMLDHSHLGWFERAERKADRSQAALLDQVLCANGMLFRLWERIDVERGHVANPSVHVTKSSSADMVPGLVLKMPDPVPAIVQCSPRNASDGVFLSCGTLGPT